MNAADSTTSILIHLAGSVALLIWAVRLVRSGATRAFGPSLRQGLARFAGNRVSAMAAERAALAGKAHPEHAPDG